MLQGFATESTVLGIEYTASPGNLGEMQNLRPNAG